MLVRNLLLLLICLFFLYSQSMATSPEEFQQQSQRVLKREISVQGQVDKWTSEKEALVSELLDQKTQLEWNRFQNKKYQQYIAHKEQRIVDLKRQKEVMGKLRKELEPYLDSSLQNLKDMISEDLPFLEVERRDRLEFLTNSLSDPDLKLSEKLRRMLEAFQVEADYGNSVEVSEEKLPLNRDGEAIVQVLRLGRIGLFYLTLDNEKAGLWDRQMKQWVPIDSDYVPIVKTTIEVVQQKRVAELVDLPLPKPTKASGEVMR